MQSLSTELRDLIDNTSSNDEDVYLSGNIERPLFKTILAELDFAREVRPLLNEVAAWGQGPDEDGSQYEELVTLAKKLAALVSDTALEVRAVTFIGQAWIGGHAMEVDDSRFGFTLTRGEYLAAREALDAGRDLDFLQKATNAPIDVQQWAGPFEIQLDEVEQGA